MSEEACEQYFTATLSGVHQLIAAIDTSSLPLRTQAVLGSALRTLCKFVGPRHKGDKSVPVSEVREAVRTLDGETGDFRVVLERLDALDM